FVYAPDRLEQRGSRFRLIREPGVLAPGADIEHFARRDLSAAALGRIRELEQLDEEGGDLLGASSLRRGHVALACDALGLNERDRGKTGEQRDRGARSDGR